MVIIVAMDVVTIITINQIKEYNMKEKEIIGYKLVKPEYFEAACKISGMITDKDTTVEHLESYLIKRTWGSFKENLEKSGVLDIWFTPVYKEAFQVGDYVKIIEAENGAKGAENRYGVISNEKCTNGLIAYPNGVKVRIGKQVWIIGASFNTVKLEKATKEEYEKSLEKTISVGGKFDVVIRDGKIWHKSNDITQFVVQMMANLYPGVVKKYDKYTVIIEDITFSKTGCQNVETKLSDWKKVYNEWNPFHHLLRK